MTIADFKKQVKGLKRIPEEDRERVLFVAEHLEANDRDDLCESLKDIDTKLGGE
jgi:hypothetical protein